MFLQSVVPIVQSSTKAVSMFVLHINTPLVNLAATAAVIPTAALH
jgi:hypothetical protein